MMMKNLIKALWFILAVAWPSIVMAAPSTNSPQWTTTTDPNKIWNKVCIESPQTETKCANVPITIIDDGYACSSITWKTVIPSNGNVTFTCYSSDATKQHTFAINCGNGITKTWVWTSSFSYTCHYDDITSLYYVSCIVDEKTPTNPSCNTVLNYGFPDNQCWDWILSWDEECDLWYKPSQVLYQPIEIGDYLDTEHIYPAWSYKWLLCKNCKIISGWNFLYEPAECLYSDTPISVMNNELLPYWWNLWIKKDSQQLTDDESDCHPGYEGKTLLLKDSM